MTDLVSKAALIERFPHRTLYARMEANLLASWERYATGSSRAEVHRVPGAAVAAFPSPPESAVYNNAVLARDLGGSAAGDAVGALEEIYADAQIERYAVWAHESEDASIVELEKRRYHPDTATRAMAMSLEAVEVSCPRLELGPPDWREYLRILGVPDRFLAGVDASDFHVRIGTAGGDNVAAAMAYDHAGDCGIYNVVTLPHVRRRGLGTAITALHLYEGRERGCTTASLQASAMAEGIYAALGFRDLGRFIEYVK